MKTQKAMMHLKAANPVGARDTDGWPSSDPGQEILRRVMSAPLRRVESTRSHPRPLLRLVSIAVAVVAIVISAALFILIPGTRQGEPAVAQVLRAAARVAEQRPQTSVPEDGYRYAKSENAYRVHYDACSLPSNSNEPCPRQPPDDWTFSVLVPHIREIWAAPDGSGRLLTKTGEPQFLGPRDEAVWEAVGRPQLDRPGISDESFGPEGLSHTDFSEYSTDPEELYDQIRSKAEGHGPSTDAEMLVLVGDLLRETVAPPDLRAALFRVAAKIPGVALLGEVTDPAGRRGIGVARASDDAGFLERNELIFDPDTSELLAERQILLERVDWIDADPGTVIGYAVYLESGVVGSTSERPSKG